MALEALDVLAVVRRGGKTHSLSALAALLRLLFRGGEVRAAWKVFDEMAARGPRPSLATFNAMILGFCHRGLVRVGAGLLAVMGRFHIVPDACSEANTITFNVLIDRYAKAGRMDEANAACREMKARGLVPDCCTFNILAAGAYKIGKAMQLAHEHQELHEVFGSQMSADVWQKLGEENREFFKAYYMSLMLKSQIMIFNRLLEDQFRLMSKEHPAGVPSMPPTTPNVSNSGTLQAGELLWCCHSAILLTGRRSALHTLQWSHTGLTYTIPDD